MAGIVAGVLCVIGAYGVTQSAIARRRREIGIRALLGESAGSIATRVARGMLGVTLAVNWLPANATSRRASTRVLSTE